MRVLTDVVEDGRKPIGQAAATGQLLAQNLGGDGTLTAIVRDKQDRPFALGCAHVLAPPGLAKLGAYVESPPDRDTKVQKNVIGRLFKWTSLVGGGAQDVDAALVAVPEDSVLAPLPDGSVFGPVVTRTDELRKEVRMFRGSIGGWARGTLMQVNLTRRLPIPGIGEIMFSGLCRSQLANAGGDSGSPVVLESGFRALSMHIAGDNVDTGWSVPFASVLAKFNVRLDSGDGRWWE